jgi:hypothetical protein
VLNGERIIDRQTVPGVTDGALDSDEGSRGPILLQDGHGPIEFRKETLTPGELTASDPASAYLRRAGRRLVGVLRRVEHTNTLQGHLCHAALALR